LKLEAASRRVLGAVVGVVLLLAGLLLGLYGLFAILYGGDSGDRGNTYVEFGGHEIDADLVGAVFLLLALLVALAAITVLRTNRRSTRSR
jgi:formate hydrogenlyase subunit 3/multisubunit Na+/H+ antiporter MnhD subunit